MYDRNQFSDVELIDQVVTTGADLIASRFGGRPELFDIEDLGGTGRATVVRARIAPNPFLCNRSVVIKQVPPHATEGTDPALLREVVAYQFATSLPPGSRPGPELLAYDVAKRTLVISDVGEVDTLATALTHASKQDEPEVALQAYRRLGAALGKMHVATASREQDFNTLLRRMWQKHTGKRDVSTRRDKGIVYAIDLGMRLFEGEGVAVGEGVKSFAREAGRRITAGYHRAFTPFDIDPDNILMSDSIQFLDYEWAGYRDAIFDVAGVVAGFPLHVHANRPTPEETEVFVRSWANETKSIWAKADNPEVMSTLMMTAVVGWLALSATVMHFGSAEATLDADKEGLLTAELVISGDAHQYQDMMTTAGALAELAGTSNDARAKDVAEFAASVHEFATERAAAARVKNR